MNPKTKTKIRVAVKDYFRMFPEDWELVKPEIEMLKQNHKNKFGELEGVHVLKRPLFTIPEKLSSMIGLKLSEEERMLFKEIENARWFAREFPQFKITSNV